MGPTAKDLWPDPALRSCRRNPEENRSGFGCHRAHATNDFPSAFFYSLLNLGEKIGIFFLHPLVRSRRGHGELEIGILAHQVKHAAEGVVYDLDGLSPRPQPGHVDVRIAYCANCEF